MKKKWLVFGLTAVMSVGAFVACDKGGDDTTGDGTGEVTAEQWTSEISAIDTNNITMQVSDVSTHGDETTMGEDKFVFDGNKFYNYSYSEYYISDGGDATEGEEESEPLEKTKNYQKSETYITEIDGVSYSCAYYTNYDLAEQKWDEPYFSGWSLADESNSIAEWKNNVVGITLNSMLMYANAGKSSFTYNAENDAYEMTISMMGITADLQVKFDDGKLVSLSMEQEGTQGEGAEMRKHVSTITFTFTGAVTLPEQEELNDYIYVLNNTYKLESVVMGGETYVVGDIVQDMELTEMTYAICLKEDGTAIIYYMGISSDEQGVVTWTEQDGVLTFTAGGDVLDSKVERVGDKLVVTEGENGEYGIFTLAK